MWQLKVKRCWQYPLYYWSCVLSFVQYVCVRAHAGVDALWILCGQNFVLYKYFTYYHWFITRCTQAWTDRNGNKCIEGDDTKGSYSGYPFHFSRYSFLPFLVRESTTFSTVYSSSASSTSSSASSAVMISSSSFFDFLPISPVEDMATTPSPIGASYCTEVFMLTDIKHTHTSNSKQVTMRKCFTIMKYPISQIPLISLLSLHTFWKKWIQPYYALWSLLLLFSTPGISTWR